MEQRLHEILMDGEQVRWTGRPSPFKLMQCPERNTFFVTWLLSGAAILLALLYLLPTLNSDQRGGADWFIMLVVVAFLPAMLSLRPLMDKLCLEKNTIYAITDRRVIALVKDDLMYIPWTRSRLSLWRAGTVTAATSASARLWAAGAATAAPTRY
ncbi:MAG: hypothetical protein ACLR0P_05570 [Oscillospiraceae bacterium]